MNVQEILTYPASPRHEGARPPEVSHNATLPAVLEAMAGASCPVLSVQGGDGSLTAWQTLLALARMMPHSDEFSEILVVSDPLTYSASAIARAVEDSDAALISLLAYPDGEGRLCVYLRINRADPSHAVRSLERYGFPVSHAFGPENSDAELSEQRLTELRHYLNI